MALCLLPEPGGNISAFPPTSDSSRIAPEVPERAEDFADRETEYTLALLEEDGDPGESLAGTIRFTVDTLKYSQIESEMENFNFKEILMTHTVTHTRKGNNGHKSAGREDLPSRPAFFSLSYMTCSMKLPMVWVASSCFCLVAWV